MSDEMNQEMQDCFYAQIFCMYRAADQDCVIAELASRGNRAHADAKIQSEPKPLESELQAPTATLSSAAED
eukprot:SAG11_NODE_3918_length_2148_cov_8.073694_3_plen_71_part_00